VGIRSKQLANISAVDALQSVMSVATSDVEALPDDYFTRPLDLSNGWFFVKNK